MSRDIQGNLDLAAFFMAWGCTVAEAPNYHILLWPEPPGPSTYLCLLCAVKDCTEAEILAHVASVHEVDAVPTPLAANPPPVILTRQEESPDARSPDVLHHED